MFRFIKEIPDTTIENSCIRLTVILKNLQRKDLEILIKLAEKYPPATRALLGAIIECNFIDVNLSNLKKSLNPITVYNFSISNAVLPTAQKWNLK